VVKLLSYTIPVKPPVSRKQSNLVAQEQALKKAFDDRLIAEHEYLVGLRIIRNSEKTLRLFGCQLAKILPELPKIMF
jgi:hypothetical protein